jgi:hypothetical protein
MAVYFVTGKLGSGKTLITVGKIRDALQEGKKVATNLNIRLEHLVGRNAKKCVLYRLPDKPIAEDMFQLGSGNDSYDEEKNGVIVLDECGTWFNARDWQDKSRKSLIDWLLHARKLGWDIYFIIQDVSMIDKQARKSICEHVVYCRRLDRLGIPFFDTIAKLLRKKGIPKPKVHMAIVKYGDLPNSLTVDRWVYMGRDLYTSYDTKQSFVADYPHKLYQVLPPYFSHGRYSLPFTWNKIMRLTKIYLRRFSKFALLSAGLAGGAFAGAYLHEPEVVEIAAPITQAETVTEKPEVVADKDLPLTVSETFDGFIIQGVAQDKDGKVIFVQISNGDKMQNLQTLRAAGYVVRMVDSCQVLIMSSDRTETIRLHTSYCSPGVKSPETVSNLFQSDSERLYKKLKQTSATELSNR